MLIKGYYSLSLMLRFSNHAQMRMKQRGITVMDVEHVLYFPEKMMHLDAGKELATGYVRERLIRVVFGRKQNFINIITVM
jgi:uncharacterized DUF497 family protein